MLLFLDITTIGKQMKKCFSIITQVCLLSNRAVNNILRLSRGSLLWLFLGVLLEALLLNGYYYLFSRLDGS